VNGYGSGAPLKGGVEQVYVRQNHDQQHDKYYAAEDEQT
jgi:hypothetical protein